MKKINFSKTLLLLASVLVFSSPLQAQDDADREAQLKERKEIHEKIKASKIAFITDFVGLTPEEAEKFWPLYNEMQKQKEDITHSIMKRYEGDREENPEITDEEALKIMKQRMDLEEKLLAIKLTYHQKFLDILAPTQVLRLYDAEDRFRRQLMERYRHRDGERKPEGRGTAPPYRGKRTCR